LWVARAYAREREPANQSETPTLFHSSRPVLVKRIGVAMTNRRREAAIGSVDGSRSLPFIIRLVAVIPLTRLKH
jgi:hypothetical protein